MGWLWAFISKFKKYWQDEPRLEIISIAGLDGWFQAQLQATINDSSFEDEMGRYLKEIKEKRWVIECRIDEWQKKTSPSQEEICSLFLESKTLLDNIHFSENISIREALKINLIIIKKIEKMIKKIEESSFLKDFHFLLDSEESNPSHTRVNPLVEELIGLQSFCESLEQKAIRAGFRKIDALFLRKDNLLQLSKTLAELKNGIQLKIKKLKEAEFKQQQKEDELERIKVNPDYQQGFELRNKRSNLIKQRQAVFDSINNFFMDLEPLFKVYKEIQPTDLIEEYCKDSINAFSNDESLAILHVLQHIEAAVVAGKLEVPLNELSAAQECLELSQKGHLQELQRKSFDLQKELAMVKEDDGGKDILLKVEEAQYRLEHFTKQASILKNQLTAIEEKIADHTNRRQRELDLLVNLVKISLNKEINIVI